MIKKEQALDELRKSYGKTELADSGFMSQQWLDDMYDEAEDGLENMKTHGVLFRDENKMSEDRHVLVNEFGIFARGERGVISFFSFRNSGAFNELMFLQAMGRAGRGAQGPTTLYFDKGSGEKGEELIKERRSMIETMLATEEIQRRQVVQADISP